MSFGQLLTFRAGRLCVVLAVLASPFAFGSPALAAPDAGGGAEELPNAPFLGSAGGIRLAQPIAGMAATPTGHGYWLVAADGGIFAFGDAGFHGSTGGIRLAQPIVGIAPTHTGQGYWLVAADGGIFAFGDAPFHGSTGGIRLNQPIVGIAPTHTGHGYWLAAADGGIFAFGDAPFLGSTGGIRLNQPIVTLAGHPGRPGYWMAAADGGIFAFGDAPFLGSTGGIRLNKPIVGMATAPAGAGYRLVAADGGIFAFGDAPFFGSTGRIGINRPIVGITAAAPVVGYWLVASDGGIFTFSRRPIISVPPSIPADCSQDVTGRLLSFIRSVGDGSTIAFVPDGCYRIDGTLGIRDRHDLTFDGNGATFRPFTPGNRTRSQWYFTHGSNITVLNMKIRGVNPAPGPGGYTPAFEAQHGIAFEGTQVGLVENVDIRDVYGDLMLFAGDPCEPGFSHPDGARNPDGRQYCPAWQITVRNSHLQGSGRQGIAIISATDLLIENSYLGESGRSLIDIEPDLAHQINRRITIRNNVTGASHHLWLAAGNSGANMSDVLIENNRARDISAIGVNDWPVVFGGAGFGGITRNWTIRNNELYVKGGAWGGIAFENVSGLTVECNRIIWDNPRNNGRTAVYVEGDVSDVRVRHNRFVEANSVMFIEDGATGVVEEVGNQLSDGLRPASCG